MTGCFQTEVDYGNANTPTILAFVTPESFNQMPNGSLVSRTMLYSIWFNCNMTADDEFGFGMLSVPGASTVSGYNNMFTTPELSQRGLGFMAHWYNAWQQTNTSPVVYSDLQFLTSIGAATTPLNWQKPGLTGPVILSAHIRVDFYKIGQMENNGTSHNGVPLPQNFSTNLTRVYLASRAAPTAALAQHLFVWNVTNFSSRVGTRSCTTPLASESLIHFGTVYEQDLNAPGPVAASQREFTLTFECPYAAYHTIWFYVEPTHGVVDAANGVMGIATGSGMAQGVGVQLLLEDTVNPSNGYAALQYGSLNRLPTFTVSFSDVYVIDALAIPPRQQVVRLKAALYRLPQSLVPGQVKASALVHIRYP